MTALAHDKRSDSHFLLVVDGPLAGSLVDVGKNTHFSIHVPVVASPAVARPDEVIHKVTRDYEEVTYERIKLRLQFVDGDQARRILDIWVLALAQDATKAP